jgi:carboxylate-amine ligase
MERNFGKSAPFSLGVEEEFQIVDAVSYDLVSRFDEIADIVGTDVAKQELMQSTVEVATGIHTSVGEAVEELSALRARLRDAAAARGARIVSAGTHPFSRYEHQEITDAERYAKLVESMRWVAERELIFGLHAHVGMDSAQKAMAVANGLRTWLPELLALSANSPFWQGRETGLASTRVKVFDTFPRSGLPPAFSSFEEFELLIERGQRTNSFADYTYIWWDLRPHPKLGTIEIRVCDAQTRIESVSALVSLIQCLAATLGELYEANGQLGIQPVTLIAENKWRAARYGLDANLIDLEHDTERPAREAVLALVELAAPAARWLRCTHELAEVERLCRRGSGASEQCAVHRESRSLLAVTQWLAEQTVANV